MNNGDGRTLSKKELESLLNYIFTLADGVGSTKQELVDTLSQISDLADPEIPVEETEDGEWQVIEDENDQPDAEGDDE